MYCEIDKINKECKNFFKKYDVNIFFKDMIFDDYNTELYYDGATLSDICIFSLYIHNQYNINLFYDFTIFISMNVIECNYNFFYNLKQCVGYKKNVIVFISIINDNIGHSNLFYIDTNNLKIYNYEPQFRNKFQNNFEKILSIFFMELYGLEYININIFYQQAQLIELKHNNYNNKHKGFCSLWCLFYIEIILLDYDPNIIYNKLFEYGYNKCIDEYAYNYIIFRNNIFLYNTINKSNIIGTSINNHHYNTRLKKLNFEYKNMIKGIIKKILI